MKNITLNEAAAPTGNPTDKFLTKSELAVLLRLKLRTIENWQRRGVLPYIKIGKVVLFHYPDVVEHFRANFRICRRAVVK